MGEVGAGLLTHDSQLTTSILALDEQLHEAGRTVRHGLAIDRVRLLHAGDAVERLCVPGALAVVGVQHDAGRDDETRLFILRIAGLDDVALGALDRLLLAVREAERVRRNDEADAELGRNAGNRRDGD